MMNYGYTPSIMDGSEYEYESIQIETPKKYSYKNYLPKVLNQGYNPICVPCSLSAYINWKENMEDGNNNRDNKVRLFDIYDSRSDTSDGGMSFKDGLKFLRKVGVETDKGLFKIRAYAKVGSVEQLKNALVANGPCVGALPVWNGDDEFWKRQNGNDYKGGHAISIVGYDKDGFLIRNSWGESFGKKGYVKLKYIDFDDFYEIWTMFK